MYYGNSSESRIGGLGQSGAGILRSFLLIVLIHGLGPRSCFLVFPHVLWYFYPTPNCSTNVKY